MFRGPIACDNEGTSYRYGQVGELDCGFVCNAGVSSYLLYYLP